MNKDEKFDEEFDKFYESISSWTPEEEKEFNEFIDSLPSVDPYELAEALGATKFFENPSGCPPWVGKYIRCKITHDPDEPD